MFDKWKNFSIGTLTVLAIGLVVWVLMFLHPSFGDNGKFLRVRFPNVDKIGVGTRVTYAGKPIGVVSSIRMLPETRNQEGQEHEPIFSYELTLTLDSHIDVYTSDAVQITTSGLMGEKNISITPRHAKDGTTRLLANNELIYATVASSVEDTVQGINRVAIKAEKTLDDVMNLLEKNQVDFQKTLKAVEITSLQLEALMKRANELDVVGKMAALLDSAHGNSKNLDNAIASISNTSKNIDAIIATVSNQEGSLGKIIGSDDFYLKTQAVMAKLDTLMSDVNQFGVLFHLDKSWQRIRRRRMVELEQLRTASEFKSYLNNEMNRITTSIDRVGIALDQANEALAKTEKATVGTKNLDAARREFMYTYTDLLGQIQQLESTLKLHGEYIAEVNEESGK